MGKLIWQSLKSEFSTRRTKVPGGWLVFTVFGEGEGAGLTFYPDPQHTWDGSSLP
jgi:hypothetical protein